MRRDFTLEVYADLLRALQQIGYRSARVVEAIRSPDTGADPALILRHDVDRRPSRSLAVARLEDELGRRSSFYVRTRPRPPDPEMLLELVGLGHEVGYHYETVSTAGGDLNRAAALFLEELAALRTIVPVTTAAMHGSPLSARSNMEVWDVLTLEDAQLEGDAYRSLSGRTGIVYLNDTGRSWGNRHNLRDRLEASAMPELTGTPSVVEYARAHRPPCLYLQTHPERWVSNPASWAVQAGLDQGTNLLKMLIRTLRDGPSRG